MARALWLAQVLRDAGLTVREYPDWKTRGNANRRPVRKVVIHETQGSATSRAADEARVIAVTGSNSADPPIAELMLDRDSVWWVLASGYCTGIKDRGGLNDPDVIQIEAVHGRYGDGRWESWADKPEQYRAYVRGVAAILRHLGLSASAALGHKEHQPTEKTDPRFDMGQFRRDVATAMSSGSAAAPIGVRDMLYKVKGQDAIYAPRGDGYAHMTSLKALEAYRAAGHKVVEVPTVADLEAVLGKPYKTGAIERLEAAAARDEVRDQAVAAAVEAMAKGGTSVDTAAVVAAVNAKGDEAIRRIDEVHRADTERLERIWQAAVQEREERLQDRDAKIAALEAELDELRQGGDSSTAVQAE